MRALRDNVAQALFGLIAFFFGVFVLPAAHQIGHRPDHVHGRDGTILWLDGGTHDHAAAHRRTGEDGTAGDHARPSDDAKPARDGREPPWRHGEGSPQHFGVAILVPALFVVPPLAQRFEPPRSLPLATVHTGHVELGPRQPRAPPV